MRKAVAAFTVAAIAVAALSVRAAPSQADRAADFERAMRTLFDSMDRTGDGLIDGAEMRRFADDTFAMLDADGNLRLTYAEFRNLDFGLRGLAERHDRLKLYADARERIWQRWRQPRPREVTRAAFRQHLRGELLRVSRGHFGVSYAEFQQARFVQDLATAFR
ncbi:EF-hand domain-containing protein [Microvirga rosea]|uniref:EF-hand domain-containing protein n=1 Tax=Microvirga rosea TaxID=2715425 RepID=UPI001D0A73DC|nr:EF-hand domain-containing protein [Microvirga rosea]MCB8823334.1 EF-hand domain-containing protein [Microvirga rosea]